LREKTVLFERKGLFFYRSPFFFAVIWNKIAEQIGIAQEETATTIQSGR